MRCLSALCAAAIPRVVAARRRSVPGAGRNRSLRIPHLGPRPKTGRMFGRCRSPHRVAAEFVHSLRKHVCPPSITGSRSAIVSSRGEAAANALQAFADPLASFSQFVRPRVEFRGMRCPCSWVGSPDAEGGWWYFFRCHVAHWCSRTEAKGDLLAVME